MQTQQQIKEAFERSAKALSLKPSLGLGSGVSAAKVTEGLTCEINEGNYKLIADMPASVGGNGGPTPGVYGRAALASCLAIGYKMFASKMNVPVKSIEVKVEADYNDGALFGTAADVPPGYTEVRYTVTIESDADKNEIENMLLEAEQHSPYLDVFSRGQKCVRSINIVSN